MSSELLIAQILACRRSPMIEASGLAPLLEALEAYVAQQEAERVEVRAALGMLATRALLDCDALSVVQQLALTKLQGWARMELRGGEMTGRRGT